MLFFTRGSVFDYNFYFYVVRAIPYVPYTYHIPYVIKLYFIHGQYCKQYKMQTS